MSRGIGYAGQLAIELSDLRKLVSEMRATYRIQEIENKRLRAYVRGQCSPRGTRLLRELDQKRVQVASELAHSP